MESLVKQLGDRKVVKVVDNEREVDVSRGIDELEMLLERGFVNLDLIIDKFDNKGFHNLRLKEVIESKNF